MVEKSSFKSNMSVFTPFLRRFTDEAAKDLRETEHLYRSVKAAHDSSTFAATDIIDRIHAVLSNEILKLAPLPNNAAIAKAADDLVKALLVGETTLFAMPEIRWDVARLSLKEQIDLRRFLRAKEHALGNEDRVLTVLGDAIANILIGILRNVPEVIEGGVGNIALAALIPGLGEMIDSIVSVAFDDDLISLGLFCNQQDLLYRNVCLASGVNPEGERTRPLTLASDNQLPPQELVDAYVGGTPFAEFLTTQVPFSPPGRIRFEHTHIVAGSGHGKSTLLACQLLEDIAAQEPPSIILIDGKGTFVEAIQRWQIFAPGTELSKRVVILNPQDTITPPALNLFAAPIREGIVPAEVKRQVEDSTIALFEYIFGAKDFKLTAKQATCLSYCVRMLFSMPGATIHTLLDLMSDPISKSGGVPSGSQFEPFIARQSPIVRRFFTDLFYHPTEYGETKRQIQNRIFDLLENPAFSAMFSATERKLDLFDIIQNRKILLVNSSPNALGEKGAPLLGRYITALALSSAYGRLAIPKSEWTPAYLILDEAQMFVDEDKTQPLLQQAREFNLGVVLAHQKLDDLTPTLRATFAANTSIRYVGGVSAMDASFMAKNMHCEPEFIMGQRKTAGATSFATYVRGFTDRSVSLSVPLGIIDKQPKMTSEDHRRLIERNRALLAATPRLAAPVATTPTVEPVLKERPEPPPDTHSEAGSKW